MHSTMARKLLKFKSVLGVLLVHITGWPFVFWGNLSVYVKSLLYDFSESDEIQQQDSWFYLYFCIPWTVAMIVSEYLTHFVRPLVIILCGILVYNIFFFGSFFMLNISWTMFILVFGAPLSVGLGLVEGLVIKHFLVVWFDKDDSFLTALFVASPGVGAAALNLVMTLGINPHGITPNQKAGDSWLFSQEEILYRVPYMFLIVGGTNLTLQLVGFILMSDNLNEKPKLADDTGSDYNTFELDSQNEQDDSYNAGTDMNGSQELFLCEDDTALQLLISRKFKIVWFIQFCMTHTVMLIYFYHKAYGATQIKGHRFLPDLDTGISVMGIAATMIVGIFMDRKGVRASMIGVCFVASLSALWSYLAAISNQWVYFVSILITSIVVGCTYLFAVRSCHLLFGNKHFGRNFAILMTATWASCLSTCAFTDAVLNTLGWFYFFALDAVFILIALVVFITMFPSI